MKLHASINIISKNYTQSQNFHEKLINQNQETLRMQSDLFKHVASTLATVSTNQPKILENVSIEITIIKKLFHSNYIHIYSITLG